MSLTPPSPFSPAPHPPVDLHRPDARWQDDKPAGPGKEKRAVKRFNGAATSLTHVAAVFFFFSLLLLSRQQTRTVKSLVVSVVVVVVAYGHFVCLLCCESRSVQTEATWVADDLLDLSFSLEEAR